jgi:hypothetical protein
MSITSMGPSTLSDQKPAPRVFATRDINRCNDIDGATSSVPYASKYTNKPETLPTVDGSTCKSLTHSRNVRDLSLYIDDIDGTRHSIKDRMMRTKRHVNPLVPEYALPSAIPADIPQKKFIRDNLSTADIDGARPKKDRVYETRNTLSTSDIEGAQAMYRPTYRRARIENKPHDIMGNEGVVFSASRFQDRCKRSTNVTDPVYHVNGIIIQNESKSKPKPLKKEIVDSSLLQTRDIDGAYSGFKDRPRREIRNIMSTADVPGAQADTIIHSMKSDRVTNPLTPVYQSLDSGDTLHPLVKPLLPSRFVEKPTLKSEKATSRKVPELPIAKSQNQTGNGQGEYKASSFADKADMGNAFV